MFGLYEFDNSSFKHFKCLNHNQSDSLSNVSYSGYRNHIQKDTLQENVKFGQCD